MQSLPETASGADVRETLAGLRDRFPAGRFIRGPEQIDYIQEPDVFHDVFGHVPMLALPVFADHMQDYGKAGICALQSGDPAAWFMFAVPPK